MPTFENDIGIKRKSVWDEINGNCLTVLNYFRIWCVGNVGNVVEINTIDSNDDDDDVYDDNWQQKKTKSEHLINYKWLIWAGDAVGADVAKSWRTVPATNMMRRWTQIVKLF